MTDPSEAMILFQQAHLAGHIPMRRGTLDRDLYLAVDEINDCVRFTYMRLQSQTITAFASFVRIEPVDDTPCFQTGYAVPEELRGQGRAAEIVAAALREMTAGFGRAGIHDFYVEAIVGIDNIASQKIAANLLQKSPVAIKDCVSGKPALRYLRRMGAQSDRTA